MSLLSKRLTLYIQTGWSVFLMIWLAYGAYHFGVTPNYGGIVGIGEAAVVIIAASFLGASLAGVLMYGLNLVFYLVQVRRHGSPTANVPDDNN